MATYGECQWRSIATTASWYAKCVHQIVHANIVNETLFISLIKCKLSYKLCLLILLSFAVCYAHIDIGVCAIQCFSLFIAYLITFATHMWVSPMCVQCAWSHMWLWERVKYGMVLRMVFVYVYIVAVFGYPGSTHHSRTNSVAENHLTMSVAMFFFASFFFFLYRVMEVVDIMADGQLTASVRMQTAFGSNITTTNKVSK